MTNSAVIPPTILNDHPKLAAPRGDSKRRSSETDLLAAVERPDDAYESLGIETTRNMQTLKQWYGPFWNRDNLHIQGESHHNLDGVWRRPNGGFVLMEAKGPLDSGHARHALKKLTRWMELAHGRNDVTWAWYADWWLTRHESWEWKSGHDPKQRLRALQAFVEDRRLGDWRSLDANVPPSIHLVCSGLKGGWSQRVVDWVNRYRSQIQSFDIWVLHAPLKPEGRLPETLLRWHRLDVLSAQVSEVAHPRLP